MRDLLGSRQAPHTVAFDHDVDLVTHGAADFAERLQTPIQGLIADGVAADLAQLRVEHAAEAAPVAAKIFMCHIVEGPDLHASDSFAEQILGQLVGVFHKSDQVFVFVADVLGTVAGLALGSPAIVGATAGVIGLDTVAGSTAQHLPDGHTGCLAHNVPQRTIDGRQATNLGTFADDMGNHFVEAAPVQLNLEWIVPQQHGCGKLVDIATDRLSHVERVAIADESLIGVNRHKQDMRKIRHMYSFYLRDFHKLSCSSE